MNIEEEIERAKKKISFCKEQIQKEDNEPEMWLNWANPRVSLRYWVGYLDAMEIAKEFDER